MFRQLASRRSRVLVTLVTASLFAVACSPGERLTSSPSDSSGLGGGSYGAGAELTGRPGSVDDRPGAESSGPADDDPEESRSDSVGGGDQPGPPCAPELVGEDEGRISVVYRVQNGQLADVCFGQSQPIAEEGWDTLALVVPPEQLEPVAFYAAYEGETDTLAFAGPVDDDNDDFVIAIDAIAGADDLEELQLTMLHEFAHVFTQTPDQLDLSVSVRDCTTYWNGFGCFKPGSIMAEWIAEFWPRDVLATLPVKGGIDEDGGSARCAVDPQFLGSYAASHPEEDFAEAFSAYVFAVSVPPEVQPRFAFFRRRPELVAFADRAAAADRTGLTANFDQCG